MLTGKIIYGIFSSVKAALLYFYHITFNWALHKSKLNNIKEYGLDLKYRLSNLAQTNIELGIYHIRQNNLNDAILRFKLVANLFDRNNKLAYYWLGWSYFLKNNFTKAERYLSLAEDKDDVGLKNFIQNASTCEQIPSNIWSLYRDLTAGYFAEKFIYQDQSLFPIIAQKIIKKLPAFSNHYNILEVGSNIGLLGAEMKPRLQGDFSIIGVEASQNMMDLCNMINMSEAIYSNLQYVSINEMLHSELIKKSKFDVIISFCGLSFAKNLVDYFSLFSASLNDEGYFALCFNMQDKEWGDKSSLSLTEKVFCFNEDNIIIQLKNAGFSNVETSDRLNEAYGKYLLITAKK